MSRVKLSVRCYMIPELKNPYGGRPNHHFGRIVIDKDNKAGYLIGYLPENATKGEKIVIPMNEFNQFIEDLGIELRKNVKRTRRHFREKLSGWILKQPTEVNYQPKKFHNWN